MSFNFNVQFDLISIPICSLSFCLLPSDALGKAFAFTYLYSRGVTVHKHDRFGTYLGIKVTVWYGFGTGGGRKLNVKLLRFSKSNTIILTYIK